MSDQLRIQINGKAGQPTLVYLPGLHGDWTYNARLREALAGRARLVEFSYPVIDAWKLEDYAKNLELALLAHEIKEGWLLAESFGSQVGWGLLAQAEDNQKAGRPGFCPQALILAGGFARHPLPRGVQLARHSHRSLPLKFLMRLLRLYLGLVRWRHRRSPTTRQSLDEHYRKHDQEASRRAMLSRYDVILASDPRPLARRTQVPVYYLTGFWDPIVMWCLVHPWLKRNCPAYRGWRLVWSAEHNVLGFQPEISAAQILRWMGG
jgi:pimeloyl-ACP methyl ester carboxylesterase